MSLSSVADKSLDWEVSRHSQSVLSLLAELRTVPIQARLCYRAGGLRIEAAQIVSDQGPVLRTWSAAGSIPFTAENPGARKSILRRLAKLLGSDTFPTGALYKHNTLLVMDELPLEGSLSGRTPWELTALAALSSQRLSAMRAALTAG